MTPAILHTTDGGILVPEQWGASSVEAVNLGAVRMTRVEILSRFAQTAPTEDQRVIGEVHGDSTVHVYGRVGGIEVRLTVENPDSRERYRTFAQAGWIYGVYDADRFVISVKVDGEWVGVEVVE